MSFATVKTKLFIFILCCLPLSLMAQNSTASPASRFGYGQINDNIPAAYRAMGSVSTAMRRKSAINPAQPASYTACDSMTFMMDIAGSAIWTRYQDDFGTKNKGNGNLEYVMLQIPIYRKWIALSAGILPYSTVGYNFVDVGSTGSHDYSVTYMGEGGIAEVYGGLSFNILNWVALGGNFYYMFGKTLNITDLSFTETAINSTYMYKRIDVRNFRFRFGAQAFHTFADKHELVLGATYEFRKKLNADYEQYELSTLEQVFAQSAGFETPQRWSVGASYVFDERLTLAFDYTQTQWSQAQFFGSRGVLSDRNRWTFGWEYRHRPLSRNYAERMLWRAGFGFSDSYVRTSNRKDWNVALGIGFPLRTTATILNLTVEYDRRQSMENMIENQLNFIVGLAINETWFFKRKL